MKRLFFLLFFILINASSNAMVPFSADNIISVPLGSSATIQGGQAIVFTQPETHKGEESIPLLPEWKPDIGQVQITSFAGQVLQVPNMTHIPSFFVYVQVLEDKSAVITERISLVLDKQQNIPFIRSYPLTLKDVSSDLLSRNVEFLRANYNGEEFVPNILQSDDKLQLFFFDDVGLASGVHLFEISYLVKDAVVVEGNTSRLFLPVLGADLPYLTERLQVLITYPQNVAFSKAKAYFGPNNQVVDEAYDVYMNENEHLVYKVKGIIPYFADLRLEVIGNAKGFENTSISEKIDDGILNNNAVILALFVGLILFLYFHFSALDLHDREIESRYLAKVRSRLKYDLGVLRYLLVKKTDSKTILAYVLYLFSKKAIDIRFNAQKQIILLRKKVSNLSERKILHFLFSFKSARLNVSKFSLTEKKIKGFITSLIRLQILKIVYREVFIGLFLSVFGIFILSCLNTTEEKIFTAGLIIVVAFIVSCLHFIRKGNFELLLKKLFTEYIQLPHQAEKRFILDVALDNVSENKNYLNIEGKDILLSEFEKSFLTQFRLKETKK